MKGKNLLVTLAVSAVLFSGCGLKGSQTIIKVNDTNISQAEFNKRLDQEAQNVLNSPLKVNIKDEKNQFMFNLVKGRIVSNLIVNALLDEEMTKRNIKVTNADLEEAIKVVIDKVGSKENLDKILKQNGVTVSQFKNDLKQEVKIKKLAETLGNSDVSDAEAKDFYNKHIDSFKYPDKVRASHILIAVNPEEIREIIKSDSANSKLTDAEISAKVAEQIRAKEAKAKELYNKAKQDPSTFAQLAKENSDDTVSAQRGGDLDFFAKNEMVPEFAQAAFANKPETVVGPVKTQFGYHIIYVKDRMAAGQEPFEKAKNKIKQMLSNEKQLSQVDNLVESLKKNAKIEYVDKSYDPEEIQKTIQQNIMQNNPAAQKDKDKK